MATIEQENRTSDCPATCQIQLRVTLTMPPTRRRVPGLSQRSYTSAMPPHASPLLTQVSCTALVQDIPILSYSSDHWRTWTAQRELNDAMGCAVSAMPPASGNWTRVLDAPRCPRSGKRRARPIRTAKRVLPPPLVRGGIEW